MDSMLTVIRHLPQLPALDMAAVLCPGYSNKSVGVFCYSLNLHMSFDYLYLLIYDPYLFFNKTLKNLAVFIALFAFLLSNFEIKTSPNQIIRPLLFM